MTIYVRQIPQTPTSISAFEHVFFFFSPPTPHSLTLLHDVTFIVDVTVQIVAEDL